MDSLTHIVAGASIGELAFGKKLRNKAIIFGAVANTIPDLDVFFSHLPSTASGQLMVHRSYTHALFVHPFLALPCAWLAYRILKKEVSFAKCFLFFWFSFFTHVMMDCCTTYGTQLLLPFTHKLISWNNLSVVDPLYTLPMLLFFLVVWFLRRENIWRRCLAAISIVLSLSYLSWSTINKFRSADFFKAKLEEQHITYDHFSTTPTMFTSWLWNVIAYNDSVMYLGEWSVFQKSDKVQFITLKRNTELLKPFQPSKATEAAIWFSQGNYFCEPTGTDTVNYYISKWGRGDISTTDVSRMFPFYSKIYRDSTGEVTFKMIEPDFSRKDFTDYFSMIHRRIFYY